MLKFIVFLFCTLVGVTVAQLRCYACSFSASDTDQSCLNIDNDTNTVSCSSTYCTIMRQEYVDPAGEIASFLRGCEETPDYLNHEITDDTFKTYYRACTSNLCNAGNGIQSVVGGTLSPTPLYDGVNLLVPGTAGASSLVISSLMTFSAMFVSYLY